MKIFKDLWSYCLFNYHLQKAKKFNKRPVVSKYHYGVARHHYEKVLKRKRSAN